MSKQLRAILRLIYAPRSLAHASCAIPRVPALLAGAASLTIIAAVPLLVVAAGFDQHHPSVSAYLHRLWAPRFMLGAAPFIAALALLLACPFFAAAAEADTPRARTKAIAVLLSPVPFVIPSLLWSALFFIARAPTAVAPGVAPSWMLSRTMQMLGDPAWSLIAMLLWVALLSNAQRRLNRRFPLPNQPFCPACDYNLTNLTSDICPECGATRPR